MSFLAAIQKPDKMVQFLNGKKKMAAKHLKTGQFVWFLNGWPFEAQMPTCLIFKCVRISNVCFSDPHCFLYLIEININTAVW
jgi:hypothetical protein